MVSRGWCFTLNNPRGLLNEVDFKEWGADYMVYQEEIGESGTHHFQGYIHMPIAARFSKFHPVLERAHFEKAKGSPLQNKQYCTKEETRISGPYEFGACPGGQGQRADLLALRDAVKSGKRGRELYDDDALAGSAIKFARGVQAMAESYSNGVRRDDLVVTFHFGTAGTGKTHCAHDDGAYYFDGMCISFGLIT